MQTSITRRSFLCRAGFASVGLLPVGGSCLANTVGAERELLLPAKSRFEKLDIARLLEKFKVPGLAVAIIEDAKLAWSGAFGLRNTANKLPVTAQTIFEAASLSKPAFAYAALQLVDKGSLDLDAPLSKYVREPFAPNDSRAGSITARMAFSHTSGLPHNVPDGKPIELQFRPGEKFQYSATGIDYLQKAVRTLSGQPLEDFMDERMFVPFGMTRSHFGWLDRFESDLAQACDAKGNPGQTFIEKYRRASPEWREAVKRLHSEFNYPPAAAGLYCTAEDYARFLLEILSPSKRDGFNLSSSLLDEMLKPQVQARKDVMWGLGWGLLKAKSGKWFWHWGNWNGLFQHFTAANRERGVGIVILTNSGNGLRLCSELVPQAIGLDIAPLKSFIF